MFFLSLLACDLASNDPATKDTVAEDTGCASPALWYVDADGDGLGTAAYSTSACDLPDGYAANAEDCDDADADVSSGSSWYADGDGDAYGAGDPTIACAAPDGFVADGSDCEDGDAAVHPDADEHCDTLDEDCDDVADNDAVDGIAVYADVDLDGFGDPNAPETACAVVDGFVVNNADCDDSSAAIAPGAAEYCDGVDENCDSLIDNDAVDPLTWYGDSDADGYGDPTETVDQCDQPTDFVADNTDCNDHQPTVSPGASELCGGGDENCDGAIDEDGASDAPLWYVDVDGDDFGTGTATASCMKPSDKVSRDGDCDDADRTINPDAIEVCGGVDENCDGTVDEATALGTTAWYVDADLDGYGGGAASMACDAPAGSAATADDCDDGDDAISPGATEACDDGIDNDCDGEINEECWTSGALTVADADATLTGIDASDAAGLVVAGGFDVTGDGLDDLVVGASESDERGAIYVVTGPVADSSLSAARRIAGNAATERADYRFSIAGDTDGDGVNDLLTRDYGVGRARLLLGPIDGSVSLASADATWVGTASAWGDATLGDVNDDGQDDAIISWAPRTCIDYGPLSGSCDATVNTPGSDAIGFTVRADDDIDGDGVVDLILGDYYGTSMYVFTAAVVGTVAASTADVVLTAGDSPGIGMGTGDFDNDGTADLAVSSSFDSDGGASAGAVYVVAGGASLVSGPLASVSAAKFTGTSAGQQVGSSVAVGDLDSDGNADLFVGAYGDGDWLLFGPLPAGTSSLSVADNTFTGFTGYASYSIAFAGDLLGTGQETLVLGSYDADEADADAGSVYVFGGGGR